MFASYIKKSELFYFFRKSKNRVEKIINYIETSSAFDYPGGVPTSMVKSGQQWDFSNAWAPLQGMNCLYTSPKDNYFVRIVFCT